MAIVVQFPAKPKPSSSAHYIPLQEVTTALAVEGVPVSAIARATKQPSADIYEYLRGDMEKGKIVELPRHDWPPGTRADRVPADRDVLATSATILRLACSDMFKLTKLQATVFIGLLSRAQASKEMLHEEMQTARTAGGEPTDQKIVDVVICHLRRKLKVHNIEIKTIWGFGYSIPTESRDRAAALLRGAVHTSNILQAAA